MDKDDKYMSYSFDKGWLTVAYVTAAFTICAFIKILSWKLNSITEVERNQVEYAEVQPRRAQPLAEGVRNRAAAGRNARTRMRIAQTRHDYSEESTDDEANNLGEEISLPDGKIGKKKLAKLQMKADKRAQREVEQREREEKKEKEELRFQKIREIEKQEEEEEAKKEEEERIKREEEERREAEEYDRLKSSFVVAEEGFQEHEQVDVQLQDFILYIKNSKAVALEDLACKFQLKTQAVIDRIHSMQENGTLSGVVDDRGKFIYISEDELQSVAKFIRQQGRVSIVDLAEASNKLINMNPEPVAS